MIEAPNWYIYIYIYISRPLCVRIEWPPLYKYVLSARRLSPHTNTHTLTHHLANCFHRVRALCVLVCLCVYVSMCWPLSQKYIFIYIFILAMQITQHTYTDEGYVLATPYINRCKNSFYWLSHVYCIYYICTPSAALRERMCSKSWNFLWEIPTMNNAQSVFFSERSPKGNKWITRSATTTTTTYHIGQFKYIIPNSWDRTKPCTFEVFRGHSRRTPKSCAAYTLFARGGPDDMGGVCVCYIFRFSVCFFAEYIYIYIPPNKVVFF